MAKLSFKTKSGVIYPKYEFEVIPTAGEASSVEYFQGFNNCPSMNVSISKYSIGNDWGYIYPDNLKDYTSSTQGKNIRVYYGEDCILSIRNSKIDIKEGDFIKVLWLGYNNQYLPIEVVNITTGTQMECFKFPKGVYISNQQNSTIIYCPASNSIINTIEPLTGSGFLALIKHLLYFFISFFLSLKCFSYMYHGIQNENVLLMVLATVGYIVFSIVFIWNLISIFKEIFRLKFRVSEKSMKQTEDEYNTIYSEFSHIKK